MRFVPSLLLTGSLLLAAAPIQPVTAELRDVTLRLGAGMEPRGRPLGAALSGTLVLAGLPKGAVPRFQLWQVPVAGLKALEQGRSPSRVKGALRQPQLQVEPGAGVWLVTGTWLGPGETRDRLLVEVWLGKRKVAWTTAPIQSQFQA